MSTVAIVSVVVPQEIESVPARRDVSEGNRGAREVMDAAERP